MADSSVSSSIDWCAKWQEDRQLYTIAGSAAMDTDFWNRSWTKPERWRDTLADRCSWIVSRLPLQPDLSVLDVGCGDGALTIPIAQKVKSVTALDASPVALQKLAAKITSGSINNIRLINLPWTQVSVGTDIVPHDIVIASFVMATLDLRRALPLLDAAASRYVFIIDSVGPRYWHYPELWPTVLHREFVAAPDYIYIVNALHQFGIYADVQIGQYEAANYFTTPDEAATHILESLKADTPEAMTTVSRYLARKLIPERGGYCLRYSQKIAMISWDKRKAFHTRISCSNP